jgi:hypothetical protein
MSKIHNLELEILEDKQELLKYENLIVAIKKRIDNKKRDIIELQRKENLEEYKPLLDEYVDVYIDKPSFQDIDESIYIESRVHVFDYDFNLIISKFKDLKQRGYKIYLYSINTIISFNSGLKTGYYVRYACVQINKQEETK